MTTGRVMSIVGSVVVVMFGYVNFSRLFLINPTVWDYIALVIASALLALVGALPGVMFGRFSKRRDKTPTMPPATRDDASPSSTN